MDECEKVAKKLYRLYWEIFPYSLIELFSSDKFLSNFPCGRKKS